MRYSFITFSLLLYSFLVGEISAQTKNFALIPITFGDTTMYKDEHVLYKNNSKIWQVTYWYSNKTPKISNTLSESETEMSGKNFQFDSATKRVITEIKQHVLDRLTTEQLNHIMHSNTPVIVITLLVDVSRWGHITNVGVMSDKVVYDNYLSDKTIYSIMDDIVSLYVFSSYHRFFTPDMGDYYFTIIINKEEISNEIKVRKKRIPILNYIYYDGHLVSKYDLYRRPIIIQSPQP